MPRRSSGEIAPMVRSSLRQFGHNIRTARIRRNLTLADLAEELGIHRTTVTRLEAGSPEVGIGVYANALHILGLETPFHDLASPARDEIGLRLDLERLPSRVRRSQKAFPRPPAATLPPPSAFGRSFDGSLKVGVVGAMSGPYALWGLVSKFAAETTAAIQNDRGGIEIDGRRIRVEVIAVDDHLCPDATHAAVERLIERGVRYIIGPNVEQTVSRVVPLAEEHGVMLFPYSMSRSLYSPPIGNTVLSQVAGYQAWPWIFRYMMQERNVRSVGVLTPDNPEGQLQHNEAVSAARDAGLYVVEGVEGYRPGDTDPGVQIARILPDEPDLILLPNLAPGEAPGLIRAARRLGFRGHFATEAAQHAQALFDAVGEEADGLVILGGSQSPGSGSRYMEEYVERYRDIAGAWHDEGGTKAYALEFILATVKKAGLAAVSDTEAFKSAMTGFEVPDPFSQGGAMMRYTGQRYLRQNRQLGLPLCVKVASQGNFQPLLTGYL